MKSVVRTLAAAALLGTAAPALAGDYYLISGGGASATFGEVAGAVRSGSKVKMWLMTLHAEPQADGASSWASQVEFDCAKKQDRRLQFIKYDRAGKLLSADDKAAPWKSPVPDTIGASVARFACATDRSEYDAMPKDMSIDDIAEVFWEQDGSPEAAPAPARRAAAAPAAPPAKAAETYAHGPLHLIGQDDESAVLGEIRPGGPAAGPRRVEFVHIYRAPQENGGFFEHYVTEYDCRARRSRMLAATEYSKARKALARTAIVGEWIAAVPGTLGEHMLTFACSSDQSAYSQLGQEENAFTFADSWWAKPPAPRSGAWGRSRR